jgi:hypothetical protein
MDEVLRGWCPAPVADQVVAAPRHHVPAATRDGRDVDQIRNSSPEMYGWLGYLSGLSAPFG